MKHTGRMKVILPSTPTKVVDMLGFNISLYHVQINTVPPGEESRGP
jgi:hypothetical protein